MIWVGILAALLVIGAMCGPRTLLHSFAMAFDMFVQCIIWDDTLGLTISARCGLLQRKGIGWPARVINFLFRSPTHCQAAIGWDLARAQAAISLLQGD